MLFHVVIELYPSILSDVSPCLFSELMFSPIGVEHSFRQGGSSEWLHASLSDKNFPKHNAPPMPVAHSQLGPFYMVHQGQD